MLPSITDTDSGFTVKGAKGEFPGGHTVDDMDDLRNYMPAAGSASVVCGPINTLAVSVVNWRCFI